LNKTQIENIGSVNQAMQLPSHIPLEPQQQARVINFMVKTVWGLTDPVRFYEIMDEALKLVVPGYYLGDNLMTWGRNNSLFDDMAFRKAWEDNVQNDADRAIAWRRYILACAAYHCAQLPGDFVECGVYRGTGIKTVIDYFGNKGFTKNFWGYDTYDYNPVEGHAFVGQEDGLFEEIQQRFSGYEQVRLVRGLLPDSLKGNSPEKICYLHIDLNSAKYEIAVLDALFDRVVPGGVIILDDYEWSGMYREQKIAEDAWLEQRRYRVFPLPTGQGLVLKR
jgi:O-methyltransferase